MTDRFFYHSFPRRGSKGSSERGLAILSSILESGLLVTPELISFNESLEDGTSSAEAVIQQKRICFTELPPKELPSHAETFGTFALEWDLQTLRQMGACPVFYVPIVGSSGEDLSGVGAAMLTRLGEAQTILERLQSLAEAVVGMDPSQSLSVTKDGKVVAETRATAGAAADLLAMLQHGTQPVSAILASLQSTFGFFYPTENLEYTGLMAYYRQREWRILGNVVHRGTALSSELTNIERERLLKIDPEFLPGSFRSAAMPLSASTSASTSENMAARTSLPQCGE